MSLPVIIIGASADARVAAEILQLNDQVVYGFLTTKDGEAEGEINNIPVLGSYREGSFQKLLKEGKTDYVVMAAKPEQRQRLLETFVKLTGKLPIGVAHPFAAVSPTADLAGGNLINASCVVGTNVKMDALNYLNPGVIIEPDAMLGSFNQIGAGVRIGAGAHIGSNVFIGAGAIIAPGVTVESDAAIGAGSVVVENVGEGTQVNGNPAKVV